MESIQSAMLVKVQVCVQGIAMSRTPVWSGDENERTLTAMTKLRRYTNNVVTSGGKPR